MKLVLCNGVFDILHIGHVNHLKQARAMGERLIVGLTADHCVKKGAGRPLNKWLDRANVLRELRCVDEVVPVEGAVQAIRWIQPTYFVKGIDYADGKGWTEDVVKACEELGVILTFTTSPKVSATDLIKRTFEIV